MPGMIIIGFSGIGKSTLSAKNDKFIDLESSCYNLINPNTNKAEKCKDWEKFYITVAYHLAKQGKYVFVSNHQMVIDEIMNRRIADQTLDQYPVIFVYPIKNIKDEWIDKLYKRLNDSIITGDNEEARKNDAAYKAVSQHYDTWVQNLQNIDPYDNNVYKIPIYNIHYDLEKILLSFIADYNDILKQIDKVTECKVKFDKRYRKNEEDE